MYKIEPIFNTKMPTSSYYSLSPGELSISDGEVDGTDYLLSSTIRLDDSFLNVSVLGEFITRDFDDLRLTSWRELFWLGF